MIQKLLKYYNNNRKTIWTTIIFIAFFVVLYYTIVGVLRENRNRELNEWYYTQNVNQNNSSNINENNTSARKQTNIENSNSNINTNINTNTSNSQSMTITTTSSAQEIINYFVNLCNENKIEEAYNMISSDCKKVLFPTINDFKNNYYNKVFTQSRSVKVETSMYGQDVYKVTYTNNLLASGGYNSNNSLQDYIFIVKENDNIKISLNKFIQLQDVNQSARSNNIFIRVLNKKIFADYEQYQVQISNNSGEKIYITPDEKKVYMLDENNVKHVSNIDELQSGATQLNENESKIIELTFQKNYGTQILSKSINFSEIITNYEAYKNENNAEIIGISINI